MKIEICDIETEFSVLFNGASKLIASGKNIVLLNGDLGAGKTTFVKNYIKALGEDANLVDSPTFSIVNEYKLQNSVIYHFDLYRLASVQEIEDIGFLEYMESGNLCFIEWPSKIAEFLPSGRILNIHINLSLRGCREYLLH
jgi:tRNA threonylcarbamoyladenosine biosynthesis protein TsaE